MEEAQQEESRQDWVENGAEQETHTQDNLETLGTKRRNKIKKEKEKKEEERRMENGERRRRKEGGRMRRKEEGRRRMLKKLKQSHLHIKEGCRQDVKKSEKE